MKTPLFTAALLLSACGAQPKTAPDATPSEQPSAKVAVAAAPEQATAAPSQPLSLAVADLASVPTCTKDREGQLVSVVAEKAFFTCSSGKWTDVDVRGKDGQGQALDIADEPAGSNCAAGGQKVQAYTDANQNGVWDLGEVKSGSPKYICQGQTGATGTAGASGATGATGAAGADGSDNHIVKVWACTGFTPDSHFNSIPVQTRYRISETAYGDVSAETQVFWDQYTLNGSLQSVGYSVPFDAEYPKMATGRTSAAVTATFNLVQGAIDGVWSWTLNRTNNTAQVTYTDADMTPATISWTHTCTLTTY